MGKVRNRKRKPGSRRDKALAKSLERNAPNVRVLEAREKFGFVTPTKVEGKVGTIDQDICDGIGQLHALGLLDGHGHDPQDMRDAAREWGHGYALLLKGSAMRVAQYERRERGKTEPRYGKADERWDLMDGALTGHERGVLLSLIVDPLIGDFHGEPVIPWARAIIDEKLLQRGRISEVSKPMRFADASDWALLGAAIRGMVMLVDAKLPQRGNLRAA